MARRKKSEKSFREKVWCQVKNTAQNFLLLFIGCILAFVIAEVFLRIYNPLAFNVKGDKIILEANVELSIKNNKIKKLDRTITYRKNSLGFRGEEPPEDFEDYLTIITVGGSTTECSLLSEGKTWTDVLGIKFKNVFKQLWINNAGLEGHSTFGHRVLMEDYIIKMKPKVVLFLVGGNDTAQEDFEADKSIIKKEFYFKSIRGLLISMSNYSEVFTVTLNIYRYIRAVIIGVTHTELNLNESEMLEMSEDDKTRIIQMHKIKYIKGYERRLSNLVQISKENGIEPILITQPALYGKAIDNITNVNLAKLKIRKNANGELAWQILELYNDVTREVGRREGILIIDLAKEMPKSSRYYYDTVHYTNEGAEIVAEIIFKFTCPFLIKKYDEYSIKNCYISTSFKRLL